MGIGLIEQFSEIFAIVFLVKRQVQIRFLSRAQFYVILIALVCLLIGDSTYIYFYFIRHFTYPTEWPALFASASYSVSFLSFLIFFLNSIVPSIRHFFIHPVSLMVLATLAVITVTLGVPLLNHPIEEFGKFYTFTEGFNLFCSFALFGLAVLAFLSASNRFWLIFSSGMLIQLLGDWAIRVEKLSGNSVIFFAYEYAWAFGIIMATQALIRMTSDPGKLHPFDKRSQVVSSKGIVLLLSALTLTLIFILFGDSQDLVRIATLLMSINVLVAGLYSQYQIDQLKGFSRSLLEVFSNESSSKAIQAKSQVPSELEGTLDEVISSRIKEIRKGQEIKVQAEVLRILTAHDIQGPVNILNSLLENSKNQLEKHVAEQIEAQIDHLGAMAQDILFERRILLERNGNLSSLKADKDRTLRRALEESLFGVRQLILPSEEKSIKLTVETQLDLPLSHSDYNSFRRCFFNLIQNAIEAKVKDRPLIVNIVLRNCSASSSSILISISDNGHGIPDNILPNIGEFGFTSGKRFGNGFGIYQSKKVVSNLGGSFLLSSKPGIGTVIEISIPVAVEDEFSDFKSSYDAILVDNEKSIHTAWTYFAAQAGKRLLTYFHPNQVLQSPSPHNREIPLYLDSFLEDGEKGETYAERLYNHGYQNIVLTTSQFGTAEVESPFIRDTRGKSPPW